MNVSKSCFPSDNVSKKLCKNSAKRRTSDIYDAAETEKEITTAIDPVCDHVSRKSRVFQKHTCATEDSAMVQSSCLAARWARATLPLATTIQQDEDCDL